MVSSRLSAAGRGARRGWPGRMGRLDRGVGRGDGIGGWGAGKGEGMYLNKTQRFGGRNVGICRKKSDVFRREKKLFISVKFGSGR